MTLLDTLQDEMRSAMKSRDQARLDALRFIVSAIRYVQVDTPNLNDEQIVEILKKEAKKRRESIVAYKDAGRGELLAKEEFELGIIETYLPETMSEDEVRAKVKEALDSAKPENFGQAMNTAMKAVGKGAEGNMVARIVKETFGK